MQCRDVDVNGGGGGEERDCAMSWIAEGIDRCGDITKETIHVCKMHVMVA